MAKLTIHRRRALWRDRARAYTVQIDGRNVGKISSGESVSFDVEPGPHSCQMKLDWCSSRTIDFDGSQDVALRCEAGGSSLSVLWGITVAKNEYIKLERV